MRWILPTVIMILILPFCSFTQKHSIEIGIGIGNVAKRDHRLGKAEAHFSLLQTFEFGKLGLDFVSGANFIPGESSLLEDNIETISAKDSRFSSLSLLYRVPLQKHIFVEPRLGYASLSTFVHTDDLRKLRQPNFSAGLGLGLSLGDLRIAIRYQYLGKTANYSGFRGATEVISLAEPVAVLLLRTSYSFNL